MDFFFVGNRPWVDFVDTELARATGDRLELLRDFDDLVRWGQAAGLLERGAAAALRETTDAHERRRVVEDAHELRADLRAACERMVRGEAPPRATVERVNRLLREHPVQLALERRAGSWRVASVPGGDGPWRLLATLAEDFARFLASADPSLLRPCANAACRIFFYDTSKNHTRRWCSMEYCGNRAKAARHRQRRG